jgi:hypothetical protein
VGRCAGQERSTVVKIRLEGAPDNLCAAVAVLHGAFGASWQADSRLYANRDEPGRRQITEGEPAHP